MQHGKEEILVSTEEHTLKFKGNGLGGMFRFFLFLFFFFFFFCIFIIRARGVSKLGVGWVMIV